MSRSNNLFVILIALLSFSNIVIMVVYNENYSTKHFKREMLMIKANRCIRLYDIGEANKSCEAYENDYIAFNKKNKAFKNTWYFFNMIAITSLFAVITSNQ